MYNKSKKKGFSLTEVLMAAGILAIGFMLIAAAFPLGVKLTVNSTENTIGITAADEALAKIQIYGIDPDKLAYDHFRLFSSDVLPDKKFNDLDQIIDNTGGYYGQGIKSVDEYLKEQSLYPSIEISDYIEQEPREERKYCWSALCRRSGDQQVDLIIFACRKTGAGVKYPKPEIDYSDLDNYGHPSGTDEWPRPIKVDMVKIETVDGVDTDDTLEFNNISDESYINEGSTIITIDTVNSTSGEIKIYHVLERIHLTGTDKDQIKLNEDWYESSGPISVWVWVVPPAENSSRYPCVYIKEEPEH